MIDYKMAVKRAGKSYKKALSEGRDPFVTVLDENIGKNELYGREYLGEMEIPIHMIKGTKTEDRRNAFSWDFLPLIEPGSEFSAKWSSLMKVQIDSGFTDPIKVYEFMNRFYVEEGNKRVSVMKYLNGDSIMADVIRIIPPRQDDKASRVYYEFLDFYRVTSYYGIEFTKAGSYKRLAEIFGQNLTEEWPKETVEKMKTAFVFFGVMLADVTKGELDISAGDAFLEYLKGNSPDHLIHNSAKCLKAEIEDLFTTKKKRTNANTHTSRPKRKLYLAGFTKLKKRKH